MKNETQETTQQSSEVQAMFSHRNLRRIFSLIYRKVRNAEDAKDLVQDTFMRVWQKQGQITYPEKSEHWLSRVATNTALDYLRHCERHRFVHLDESGFERIHAYDSVEELVLLNELTMSLENALTQLSERERTALVLRDLQEMPACDVAARMECSTATVRAHISHARVKLQRYFEVKDRKLPTTPLSS